MTPHKYRKPAYMSAAMTCLLLASMATSPIGGQPPATRGCVPVSERTGQDVGCWILASEPLGTLNQPVVFWHLDTFPTRAAAQSAKGPGGTVVEAVGKVWLLTIGEAGWRPRSGERIAEVGPIQVKPGQTYTAHYMEGISNPGDVIPKHRHPGPEAWYTVAGGFCAETPQGKQTSRANEGIVIPADDSGWSKMTLTVTGTEIRRSLVLVLHNSGQPWTSPVSDWSPQGLCQKADLEMIGPGPSQAHTPATENVVFVSVPGTPVRLETFVYKPEDRGKFPVVIFNHGSAGGAPQLSLPSREIAEYFVRRRYVVVVPMRRGRGKSTGVSPESEEKNCDPHSWKAGLQLSFEDISAVLGYLGRIPEADATRVILAGASRGGFLSVAYAANGKHRKDVAGVINFVGGWVAQAEDNCSIDFNYTSFESFGAKTKVPMLWLYGSHDAFYGTESIKSYPEVFVASGGNVHFELIDGVPQNGHWLPAYPNLWSGYVDAYLASLK